MRKFSPMFSPGIQSMLIDGGAFGAPEASDWSEASTAGSLVSSQMNPTAGTTATT